MYCVPNPQRRFRPQHCHTGRFQSWFGTNRRHHSIIRKLKAEGARHRPESIALLHATTDHKAASEGYERAGVALVVVLLVGGHCNSHDPNSINPRPLHKWAFCLASIQTRRTRLLQLVPPPSHVALLHNQPCHYHSALKDSKHGLRKCKTIRYLLTPKCHHRGWIVCVRACGVVPSYGHCHLHASPRPPPSPLAPSPPPHPNECSWCSCLCYVLVHPTSCPSPVRT